MRRGSARWAVECAPVEPLKTLLAWLDADVEPLPKEPDAPPFPLWPLAANDGSKRQTASEITARMPVFMVCSFPGGRSLQNEDRARLCCATAPISSRSRG